MYPTLNENTTKRFRYYFDRRVTKNGSSFFLTSRRFVAFLLISFLCLAWLPAEKWMWKANEIRARLENENFLTQLKSRQWEMQCIYKIISSFQTGLKKDQEKKLAFVIFDLAQEYKLDPYLILAVIKTESYFNHRAVSVAGARGLMQILPPVGAELAGQLNISYQHDHTLFRPADNVRMGTHYLTQLIYGFHGDLHLALQAYNMGPNFIRRAMNAGQPIPKQYADRVFVNYKQLLKVRNSIVTNSHKEGHENMEVARLTEKSAFDMTSAWRAKLANP